MKSISLKMSKNFKIELLCRNNVYELENNSCKLAIEHEVDPELTYKMHISHAGEKSFVVMDKGEDGISKLLTAPEINSNGVYYIQIEGIKEDYRIVSNQIRLEVGSFINAEHIPSPEEEGVIDEILIRLNGLDEALASKQNKLSAGFGIKIENDTVKNDVLPIVNHSIKSINKFRVEGEDFNVYDSSAHNEIKQKQDKLIAGDNITIENNVISAVGGGTGDVTKAYVDENLALKQNKSDMSSYALKSDIPTVDVTKDYVDAGLDTKQNKGDYALKSDIPTVPTNVSAFTNDAGYVKTSELPTVPTKTSQLTNDSGFVSGAVVRTVNNTAPDANGNVNVSGGGGGDVTKAYVDAQASALQSQIDDELAEIQQLNETLIDIVGGSETVEVYSNTTDYKVLDPAGRVEWINYQSPLNDGDRINLEASVYPSTGGNATIVLATKGNDGKLTVVNSESIQYSEVTLKYSTLISGENIVLGITVARLRMCERPGAKQIYNNYSSATTYNPVIATNNYEPKATLYKTITTGGRLPQAESDIISLKRLISNNRVITVSALGDKDYRTIKEAVNFAKTIDSSSNPITILIYPAIYEEVVIIGAGHHISLVGINKHDCVLIDKTGEYENAPLKIVGDCIVKNLTIISNHDNNPEFINTRTVPAAWNEYGYGLHIDSSLYSDDSYKLTIVEDCIIRSAQCSAVGLGMQKNNKVIFNNCEFYNDAGIEFENANIWRPWSVGAVVVHPINGNINSYQYCEFNNCKMYSERGKVINITAYSKERNDMTMAFHNCIGWSKERGINNVVQVTNNGSLSTYDLEGHSFGNNIASLNA